MEQIYKTSQKDRDYAKAYRKEHPEYYANYEKQRCKRRMKENRVILHNLKINGCAICGYNKCDASLDFHHSNPKDKKFFLNAERMRLSDDRIIDELNKCVLLCSNCHRELHYKERNFMEENKNENN